MLPYSVIICFLVSLKLGVIISLNKLRARLLFPFYGRGLVSHDTIMLISLGTTTKHLFFTMKGALNCIIYLLIKHFCHLPCFGVL